MRTVIIIIVFVGFCSVASSIILGNHYFDGVVVDNPYETGLSWDKTRHENEMTGWQTDVRNEHILVGNGELVLSVCDSTGKPLKGAEVTVTVSRPSSKAYDRTFKAKQSADGLYKAAVDFPLYGYWDLEISILKEGKRSGFEKRIFAEKET